MRFIRAAWLFALVLGSAAIAWASLAYFNAEEEAPFVLEKLPLPNEEWWRNALTVHVISAIFSLPACISLVTTTLLRRAPRVHRWLGRLTGLVVLFALAPSGFYLSLHAKAGMLSTVGFMLSGAIVVVAMVQGIRTARARRYLAHRRAVLHVLGQLSVAVSSRAMLMAFDALELDPDRSYIVALWVPVVLSVVVVEVLVAKTHRAVISWRSYGTATHTTAAAHAEVSS